MPSLWLNDGLLVVEDGSAILCDDCPCEGGDTVTPDTGTATSTATTTETGTATTTETGTATSTATATGSETHGWYCVERRRWYCLQQDWSAGTATSSLDTGTGTIGFDCYLLSQDELLEYLLLGYSLRTGPHDSELACLVACGEETGTSTGSDEVAPESHFCVEYTPSEAEAVEASGEFKIHSGPYDTEVECDAACGDTGTGTSTGTRDRFLEVLCTDTPIPKTLYATIIDLEGDCDCVDGISVTLEYDSRSGSDPCFALPITTDETWYGERTVCGGQTLHVWLAPCTSAGADCNNPSDGWKLYACCGSDEFTQGAVVTNTDDTLCMYDPFYFYFGPFNPLNLLNLDGDCCDMQGSGNAGQIVIIITE